MADGDSRQLTEGAIKALDLPKEERVRFIRSPRWIGYPIAKSALDRLEELLVYPKSHRMPNLLLVGETNNGKTTILARFRSLHPVFDNKDKDGSAISISVPVLVVQAPPGMDESRFYAAILDSLSAPHSQRDRAEKKLSQVLKILSHINIGVLAIDEIQHVLAAPTGKQRAVLNAIKYLGNELQIPIVGVGTPDARRAVQTDPQLANRFEPFFLLRWELNDDFRKLLATFEQTLPLKSSSVLYGRDLSIRLHSMSEGLIGEVSTILSRAAVKAVETGAEQITPKILDSIKWVTPGERRSYGDRIGV